MKTMGMKEAKRRQAPREISLEHCNMELTMLIQRTVIQEKIQAFISMINIDLPTQGKQCILIIFLAKENRNVLMKRQFRCRHVYSFITLSTYTYMLSFKNHICL